MLLHYILLILRCSKDTLLAAEMGLESFANERPKTSTITRKNRDSAGFLLNGRGMGQLFQRLAR